MKKTQELIRECRNCSVTRIVDVPLPYKAGGLSYRCPRCTAKEIFCSYVQPIEHWETRKITYAGVKTRFGAWQKEEEILKHEEDPNSI